MPGHGFRRDTALASAWPAPSVTSFRQVWTRVPRMSRGQKMCLCTSSDRCFGSIYRKSSGHIQSGSSGRPYCPERVCAPALLIAPLFDRLVNQCTNTTEAWASTNTPLLSGISTGSTTLDNEIRFWIWNGNNLASYHVTGQSHDAKPMIQGSPSRILVLSPPDTSAAI